MKLSVFGEIELSFGLPFFFNTVDGHFATLHFTVAAAAPCLTVDGFARLDVDDSFENCQHLT